MAVAAAIASRFRSTITRQLKPSVAASLEILYPNVNLPIPRREMMSQLNWRAYRLLAWLGELILALTMLVQGG